MLKSVTKIIDIGSSPFEAMQVLSNPNNWPKFALNRINKIQSSTDGYWKAETLNGYSIFKIQFQFQFGIIDYTIIDNHGKMWPVSVKIGNTLRGTYLIVTYKSMTTVNDVDKELSLFKEILENTGKYYNRA